MDVGDVVGDFELATDTGSMLRLSDELAQGPVVLFFYPKALTSGCTKESCHFRDLAAEFAEVGGRRLGISADPVDRQRAFSETHSFDYPLLSDPDRAVATAFGVKRPRPRINKRATFVIDTNRRGLAVITSEINMDKHADRALAVLRTRNAATPT
jgi:peroxiredoxin Q/BCP